MPKRLNRYKANIAETILQGKSYVEVEATSPDDALHELKIGRFVQNTYRHTNVGKVVSLKLLDLRDDNNKILLRDVKVISPPGNVIRVNPYLLGSHKEELNDWAKIKAQHPHAIVRSKSTKDGVVRLAIYGSGRNKKVIPISFLRKSNPKKDIGHFGVKIYDEKGVEYSGWENFTSYKEAVDYARREAADMAAQGLHGEVIVWETENNEPKWSPPFYTLRTDIDYVYRKEYNPHTRGSKTIFLSVLALISLVWINRKHLS